MASNKAYKEIYITKDVARFSFIWYENSDTIANCFRNSNTVKKKMTEKNIILPVFQNKTVSYCDFKDLLFYLLHPAYH